MLSTIWIYLFPASAVLVYGIGAQRLLGINDNLSQNVVSLFKSLFVSLSTCALSFLCIKYFLIPVDLAEFFPFLTVILFILISFIVEIFVSIGVKENSSEVAVPFLSVLLSLSEGIYISDVLTICTCSILGFYFFTCLIFCLRVRIDVHMPDAGLKTYSVLLLSLAVIFNAVYGCNASWLKLNF